MNLEVISPPDSLLIAEETMQDSMIANIPPQVVEAFIVSLIVLIIATLGKFLISKSPTISDWGAMLIELPIDVCAIVSTIIASTKFDVSINVTILALSAVIPILLCSYFRREGFNLYTQERWFLMVICSLVDVALAGAWIMIVINILF